MQVYFDRGIHRSRYNSIEVYFDRGIFRSMYISINLNIDPCIYRSRYTCIVVSMCILIEIYFDLDRDISRSRQSSIDVYICRSRSAWIDVYIDRGIHPSMKLDIHASCCMLMRLLPSATLCCVEKQSGHMTMWIPKKYASGVPISPAAHLPQSSRQH